ncbi:exopolysaccharide production protein YjbE [Methylobacterium nigriterrae]|uniref:exopolysaccharide production protein YjbE n=1 Tax=Methylobacterium nigriterrae TaxID=3127512 RepID=UPI0030133BA3
MKVSHFVGAAAILALTAGSALAAPCNTGSTKGKSPNDQAMNDKSSDVDRSSKNLAGGQQPASPGTVGAMNNVGANQQVGQKDGSGSDGKQAGNTDPASKNLAGGQQPASPGTVGAMNNAGANQQLGQKDDDC